jgi:hypothetical protein
MNKIEEYIVVNKTLIENRIKWLEERSLNKWQDDELRLLRNILYYSIPLSPLIEDAFIGGSHFKEKYLKEIVLENSNIILKEPDFDKYISKLKI